MAAKNAVIFHGTGTRPDEFWFPYLKENLESRGYSVWLPQLPNADKPNIAEWLPFALDNGTFTENTVLIGHSKGSALILHILEKIDVRVKQAILVAGYAEALPKNDTDDSKDEFKWDTIRSRVENIVFVNSDNDPWKCDDKQGRILFDHIGGTQIILHGEGHMGSGTFKQPYKKFPLLTRLVVD
ncbi:MAG TPA: alpha/beta hydrolase [Candidatus Paceibacterota bacterium]|nr:alpha/beta hydrolase [Candidatus Paceibacterota bacterium]